MLTLPAVRQPSSVTEFALSQISIHLPRITREHIITCPHLSKKIADIQENIEHQYPDDWKELMDLKEMLDATRAGHHFPYKLRERAIDIIEREAKEQGITHCPYEKDSVYKLVSQLSTRYDFSDPRVTIIARELIQQFLIVQRFDESATHDALLIMQRGALDVHPSLKARSEFSKTVIEGLKALEEITREKMSFKVEGELSFADILSRIKNPDVIDATVNKIPEVRHEKTKTQST